MSRPLRGSEVLRVDRVGALEDDIYVRQPTNEVEAAKMVIMAANIVKCVAVSVVEAGAGCHINCILLEIISRCHPGPDHENGTVH